MKTKTCNVCEVEKSINEFRKQSAQKDGLRADCKICGRRVTQAYYRANREKIKKSSKEYRAKNKEKIRKTMHAYRYSPSLYKLYADRLTVDEQPMADKDGFLLVKCTYCGKYFKPATIRVHDRISALNQRIPGECRLYCSKGCKKTCPIFNKTIYPSEFKKATSREVQAELRQMVLNRDDYSCQICGGSAKNSEIHCHHIEGLNQNPIESADIDVCITLCKLCHKKVHQQKGCRYFDLKCKEAA